MTTVCDGSASFNKKESWMTRLFVRGCRRKGRSAKGEVDELVVRFRLLVGMQMDAAGPGGRKVKMRDSTGSGVSLIVDWRGLLQLSVDGFGRWNQLNWRAGRGWETRGAARFVVGLGLVHAGPPLILLASIGRAILGAHWGEGGEG